MRLLSRLQVVASIFIITSCGGGSTPTIITENNNPVFISGTSVVAIENTASIDYIAQAIDSDGDTLSYSISGGEDQSLFNINMITGALTFNSAPDFESPKDHNLDNEYMVEITASDGNGGTDSIEITIVVTDQQQFSLVVGYPTENANVSNSVDQITVRGKIIDNEDGVVSDSDISYLEVNSNFATFDFDDPSKWSLQVPVSEGVNVLDFSLQPSSELATSTTQNIEAYSLFKAPRAIVLDDTENRALMIDEEVNALFAVDLTTGIRTTISDNTAGIEFSSPNAIALDSNNNQVLVIDNILHALIAVDLNSGNRTILSDENNGTGPNFSHLSFGVVVDSSLNRALVNGNGLLAVDLETGNRTVLSDESHGTGPAFSSYGLAIDTTKNRVLGVNATANLLLAVDLATGNRTIVSDSNQSNDFSLDFDYRRGIAFDEINNRALVITYNIGGGLLAVDLDTGTRSVLSAKGLYDPTRENAPPLSSPHSVVYDSARDRALVTDSGVDALIAVDLSTGDHSSLSDDSVSTGDFLGSPVGITLDGTRNRALLVDAYTDTLFEVDLTTGHRTIISDGNTGTGVVFDGPRDVIYDETRNRALVIDSGVDALFAVDLGTGNRTILSDNDTGTGSNFLNPNGIAFDYSLNRILVIDTWGVLFSVDLTTGDRTIISDDNIGAGTLFGYPAGIEFDSANNRVLVADFFRGVISVDLSSGDRTVISGRTSGEEGSGYEVGGGLPYGVAHDSDNNRVFVTDEFNGKLFSVDLATGHRTLISDDSTLGIGFDTPQGLAFDSANDRLFVTDRGVWALFVVDIQTGERAIVSKSAKHM